MTVSVWQDRIGESERTGILIIGAGLTGVSAAYWLRKIKPELPVTIIEGRKVAGGASGRAAGYIMTGTSQYYSYCRHFWGRERAKEIWEFTRENHALLRAELLKKHGAACGYRRTGSLRLAVTDEEVDHLRQGHEEQSTDGFPATLLNAASCREETGSSRFKAGILSGDVGDIVLTGS